VIAFRRRHPVLSEERFYRAEELRWFGAGGAAPDWDGPAAAVGCTVAGGGQPTALCLLFNAGTSEARFALPAPPAAGAWRVAIDTAAATPGDVAEPGGEREIPGGEACAVAPRSLAVLLACSATQ